MSRFSDNNSKKMLSKQDKTSPRQQTLDFYKTSQGNKKSISPIPEKHSSFLHQEYHDPKKEDIEEDESFLLDRPINRLSKHNNNNNGNTAKKITNSSNKNSRGDNFISANKRQVETPELEILEFRDNKRFLKNPYEDEKDNSKPFLNSRNIL